MNRRVLTCMFCTFAMAVAQGQNFTPSGDLSLLKYWSADELRSESPGMLLTTRTHLLKLVHVGTANIAESHEGTSDVFFVESGRGSIDVGGEMEAVSVLPDMPGEMRGRSIKGGKSYELKPGAMIDIPPSIPYMFQGAMTLVQLRINVGMHPYSVMQTQQSTLPVTPARPRVTLPLNSDQGAVTYWSAETLQHAHETLTKTAAGGGSVADPRDLLSIPITRTHAYNFMHRIMGKNGQPPGVEFHEGNTDIYFVVGGSATLMTSGEIENREHIANRPGEDRGTLISNGKGYRMMAGDVVNMPPSIPHQSLPDPVGFTYMLIKVNTGTYPWSMVEK